MTPAPLDDSLDHVLELSEKVFTGLATAEEIAILEANLLRDERLRGAHLRYGMVHARLPFTDLALPAACPGMPADVDRMRSLQQQMNGPPGRRALGGFITTVALLAALLSCVTWWRMDAGVEVVRGVGEEYAQENARLRGRSGKIRFGETIELTQGLIEIAFPRASATAVIEAPARFQVRDTKTLQVQVGRVTAHVQDGKQGLRVLTPEMDVLDLGTRFAVDVAANQRSEVHVFEGKVEAGLPKQKRQLLLANESLRFDGTTQPMACEQRRQAFVESEELSILEKALASGQMHRAVLASQRIQQDPSLLAWYDFNPTAEGGHVENGAEVSGARIVQGRFPGTQAIEFIDDDDHVKVELDAQVPELTLMTWVRLNQGLRSGNCLYAANGWDSRGQIHWIINNDRALAGSMRFGVNLSPVSDEGQLGHAHWAVSRETVMSELGRWLHLAVVYNADNRSVKLFVNGQLDSESVLPERALIRLGRAQIGNWEPIGNRARRHLRGRMDEFVALSRALSDTEVETYYQETSPYQVTNDQGPSPISHPHSGG